jgi:hypothetical protein
MGNGNGEAVMICIAFAAFCIDKKMFCNLFFPTSFQFLSLLFSYSIHPPLFLIFIFSGEKSLLLIENHDLFSHLPSTLLISVKKLAGKLMEHSGVNVGIVGSKIRMGELEGGWLLFFEMIRLCLILCALFENNVLHMYFYPAEEWDTQVNQKMAEGNIFI